MIPNHVFDYLSDVTAPERRRSELEAETADLRMQLGEAREDSLIRLVAVGCVGFLAGVVATIALAFIGAVIQ